MRRTHQNQHVCLDPVQQLEQRQREARSDLVNVSTKTARIRSYLRDTKVLVIPRLGNNAQKTRQFSLKRRRNPNKHMRGRELSTENRARPAKSPRADPDAASPPSPPPPSPSPPPSHPEPADAPADAKAAACGSTIARHSVV